MQNLDLVFITILREGFLTKNENGGCRHVEFHHASHGLE